mmetsp:Transcript_52406/g.145242  ORF Transcript_52406/g.145242 Transcript_52406/m.145242 type:complete len:212 (+) Transcript_52406:2111-2746(+)
MLCTTPVLAFMSLRPGEAATQQWTWSSSVHVAPEQSIFAAPLLRAFPGGQVSVLHLTGFWQQRTSSSGLQTLPRQRRLLAARPRTLPFGQANVLHDALASQQRSSSSSPQSLPSQKMVVAPLRRTLYAGQRNVPHAAWSTQQRGTSPLPQLGVLQSTSEAFVAGCMPMGQVRLLQRPTRSQQTSKSCSEHVSSMQICVATNCPWPLLPFGT